MACRVELAALAAWSLGASLVFVDQSTAAPEASPAASTQLRQDARPAPPHDEDRQRRESAGPQKPARQTKSRKAEDKERQAAVDALSPELQRRLSRLAVEQRRKFMENWRKWCDLSEDERERFFWKSLDERERQSVAIDEAIDGLGFELDADRRDAFALRYRQERRKIEEALCKEMNAKRKAMVDAMLAALKEEFALYAKQPPAKEVVPSAKIVTPATR